MQYCHQRQCNTDQHHYEENSVIFHVKPEEVHKEKQLLCAISLLSLYAMTSWISFWCFDSFYYLIATCPWLVKNNTTPPLHLCTKTDPWHTWNEHLLLHEGNSLVEPRGSSPALCQQHSGSAANRELWTFSSWDGKYQVAPVPSP